MPETGTPFVSNTIPVMAPPGIKVIVNSVDFPSLTLNVVRTLAGQTPLTAGPK
jgi:hypothetical protein